MNGGRKEASLSVKLRQVILYGWLVERQTRTGAATVHDEYWIVAVSVDRPGTAADFNNQEPNGDARV